MLDIRLAEVPTPGFGRGAPDHRRAPLRQETSRLDGRHRTQLFEDGDAGRQQRFANVFAREVLPLEQPHAPAFAREHGRRRAAARATTDHDDIGVSH